MMTLLFILFAYLIGSIPFSHILPKIKGEDIREKGTRNIGATNALVVAGPVIGALALVGDVGKGFLAIYLAQKYIVFPWGVALVGLAAIVGHDFSLFLKFKGGKGVATTAGALLALNPGFAIIILLLWILLILISRYFIPSTIIIMGAIPILMGVAGLRFEYIVFAGLAFLLGVYTHRADIQRLIEGKELNTSQSVRKFLNK
jgi:glycerol-3-phosphate acyltransferase PlsY